MNHDSLEQGGRAAAAGEYRTGGTLGTTIYQGERSPGQQPVAMVFNLPVNDACDLAARIVALLNRERSDEFLVRLRDAAQAEADATVAERERCAKITERWGRNEDEWLAAEHLAKEIRDGA
jgi:hypothetical protein